MDLDRVDPADIVGRGGDCLADAVLPVGHAAVAKDDVVVSSDGDRVVDGATHGDIRSARDRDLVVATDRVAGGLHQRDLAVGPVGFAAVAQSHVGATRDVDDVFLGTAHHLVPGADDRDRVVATDRIGGRTDAHDPSVGPDRLAAIAQSHVVAEAAGIARDRDGVVRGTAHHLVLDAGDRDLVVGADIVGRGLDQGDLAVRPDRLATIAKRDVVASGDVDLVLRRATHRLVARADDGDRIVATDRIGGGLHRRDLSVGPDRLAAIAQSHVVCRGCPASPRDRDGCRPRRPPITLFSTPMIVISSWAADIVARRMDP